MEIPQEGHLLESTSSTEKPPITLLLGWEQSQAMLWMQEQILYWYADTTK